MLIVYHVDIQTQVMGYGSRRYSSKFMSDQDSREQLQIIACL